MVIYCRQSFLSVLGFIGFILFCNGYGFRREEQKGKKGHQSNTGVKQRSPGEYRDKSDKRNGIILVLLCVSDIVNRQLRPEEKRKISKTEARASRLPPQDTFYVMDSRPSKVVESGTKRDG
jgi:hypothetical protein